MNVLERWPEVQPQSEVRPDSKEDSDGAEVAEGKFRTEEEE